MIKTLFLRVIFSRNNFLLFFTYLFISFSGFAQILNDSTVNVYGPKTTRYFLEEDVYNSIDTLYYLDTALNGFHRYTFPQRHNYFYQDLGNKATAIEPLFYAPPSNIGFRSGFSAYSLYFDDLLKMRFYDTKSPYSKFSYVQGGRGVSFLETELSRNISPDWNVGISFNRLSANPQIQFDNRPLNPEVNHYSYSAYTAFKTKNKKYYVDAYFQRMRHQVHETGGVQIVDDFKTPSGDLNLTEFFKDYNLHTKELQAGLSGDLRINYHLYHQFNFSKLIGVYHLFDYDIQSVSYEDQSKPYNTKFYGAYYMDTTATLKQSTIFKIFRNDIGLKGEVNEFKYRLYYRRRNFFVDNYYTPDVTWQTEDVAGGEIAVRFSERSVLHFNGELLANSSFYAQANDYRVNFSFENRYVKANFTRGLYTPNYLQEIYFGNHNSWDKRDLLSPTLSDDLSLSTFLPLGIIKITPQIKVSRVDKYVYYKVGENNQVEPFQLKDQLFILSPGLDFHLKVGHFNLRNSFTYNLVNTKGKTVFRVPQMMENFQLYYERAITRKSHVLQVGFDGHWKSSYWADAYMPSIMQFYIQDQLNVKPYFITDFFAAMKINRTRVFMKVSNLTQGLGNEGGYIVRPYYYGFVRVLDVGVNWMFFD